MCDALLELGAELGCRHAVEMLKRSLVGNRAHKRDTLTLKEA
jgi:hypothetical protein